jgi:uncharacterized protein
MRVTKTIVASLVLFTMAISAKPSWCRYAHTYVEIRICSNRNLINLDYELNGVYNRVARILKRYDYSRYRWLKRSENRWIKSRDEDCYDMPNSCIVRKYESRIDYLYSILDEYR